MPEPKQNTGFIEQKPLGTDFIAGAETGIIPQDINDSGDWKDFLPVKEKQSSVYFDSFACVTFSALNALETLFNFHMAVGNIPQEKIQWLRENGYLNEYGKVNFSDRFTAKMSGTTKLGNFLGAVADCIRNHGLIPQKDWEYPVDQQNPVFNWDEFYREIPQSLKDKGQAFRANFEVMYEWVGIDPSTATVGRYRAYLKRSPLQIATAVCPPWNAQEIIGACSLKVGHATILYQEEGTWNIFDSYDPFLKKLASNYPIPYAIGFSVEAKKIIVAPSAFKHNFTRPIYYKERSDEVMALQEALKVDGVFSRLVLSTGYYGEITRTAVLAFQQKHKVASPQELAYVNGRWVGKKTLSKLNELFNH